MPGIVQLALACAVMLVSALPLGAQNNSTLRPGTDHGVTTGIGTGSNFRNVPPPTDQPPPDTSRKFIWDTPEANAKPQAEERREDTETGKATAAPAPAPAPEVKEDPRTMITRDRIESPQH
jgi:hypothetical protein